LGAELDRLAAQPSGWGEHVAARLIIREIIQTIRQDLSRSDGIDDPSNVSRPDPSGADQIDAERTRLRIWWFLVGGGVRVA
jgi:hypothetical protein